MPGKKRGYGDRVRWARPWALSEAFVACSETMAQYLVNHCTGFIYTTALPPAVIGAVDAALDLVPQMNREREELWAKVGFLRGQLQAAGLDTGCSSTQILPVIIGDEAQTMALAAHLEKNGILASGIRFPTVPASTARIRLALSAAHTWRQIHHLVSVILAWKASVTS